MNKKHNALTQMIQPVVTGMGYELVGIDYFIQGKHSLLRVYVDNDHGITVDDCERISRQLNALLDVENPIAHQYTLEVSSPGLNRPLFTLDHFKKQIGKSVAIQTREPIQAQKNFKGTLQEVQADKIILFCENKCIELPLNSIQKAHLIVSDSL